MNTTKRNKIHRPTNKGVKTECYVLVFSATEGKHKKQGDKYVLNIKDKTKCISIVDARAVLTQYLHPNQIPSYDKCRELVKNEGFLGVMKLPNGKYILS